MGLRAAAARRMFPVGGIAGTGVPDWNSAQDGTELRAILQVTHAQLSWRNRGFTRG
jgi:hypothetical protein